MNKIPVSIAVSIALAASLGFVGGYVFHLSFGLELSAARQALLEKETSQRVLDAYAEVLQAEATHKALSSAKSLEEMRFLQAKSKKGLLETIDRFSRIAASAEDRREKLLAQAFLPSATKIRDAVNAEPSNPSIERR